MLPDIANEPDGRPSNGALRRLFDLPAVREFEYKPRKKSYPGFHLGAIRKRNVENLTAALVYCTGVPAATPCSNCQNGRGLWQLCILTPPGIPAPWCLTGGCCANCYYQGKSGGCSLKQSANVSTASQFAAALPDGPQVSLPILPIPQSITPMVAPPFVPVDTLVRSHGDQDILRQNDNGVDAETGLPVNTAIITTVACDENQPGPTAVPSEAEDPIAVDDAGLMDIDDEAGSGGIATLSETAGPMVVDDDGAIVIDDDGDSVDSTDEWCARHNISLDDFDDAGNYIRPRRRAMSAPAASTNTHDEQSLDDGDVGVDNVTPEAKALSPVPPSPAAASTVPPVRETLVSPAASPAAQDDGYPDQAFAQWVEEMDDGASLAASVPRLKLAWSMRNEEGVVPPRPPTPRRYKRRRPPPPPYHTPGPPRGLGPEWDASFQPW